MAQNNPKTGDCIQANTNAFLDFFPEHNLIQGIVTNTGTAKGKKMAHCWIEVGGLCFDFSNGRNACLPRSRYYEAGKVEYVERFTAEQVRENLLKTKRYDWWSSYINELINKNEVL